MPELKCGSGADNIMLAVTPEREDLVGDYCLDDSTVNLFAAVRWKTLRDHAPLRDHAWFRDRALFRGCVFGLLYLACWVDGSGCMRRHCKPCRRTV